MKLTKEAIKAALDAQEFKASWADKKGELIEILSSVNADKVDHDEVKALIGPFVEQWVDVKDNGMSREHLDRAEQLSGIKEQIAQLQSKPLSMHVHRQLESLQQREKELIHNS